MSGGPEVEGRVRDRAGSGMGLLDADEGVGWAALQTALVDLDRALCRDRCHAVVSAPPGPGKRQLLDALAERLAGSLEVVIVDPSLLDDDVCTRILDALGERPEVDAEMRLLSVLQALGARGSALVLLIDDAGSLAAATLRRLGRLAALSRPDLRLALIVVDGGEAGCASLTQVVGALGVSAEKVVLGSRPGEGGSLPAAAAPAGPALPPQSPDERADEERALESMRLAGRTRSGAVRHLAAVGLGLTLALVGANHIAFQALDPLAAEPPPAVAEPAPTLAGAAGPVAVPAFSRVAAVSRAPGSETPAVADPEAPAPVSTAPAASPRARAVAPRPPLPAAPAPEARPAPRPLPAQKVAAARPAAPAAAPQAPRVPVSVNAEPWARIEVDGREVGVTPLGNVPLEPGPHRFRAHLPDGRVVERTTDVDAHRDHVVFP